MTVYAAKIDGYGLEAGDYDDYQEYCNIELSDNMEDIEKYITNNPISSNERIEILEIEDWNDALTCLVNFNEVFPDNVNEVFSSLAELLSSDNYSENKYCQIT